MGAKYDFCGWATKHDMLCADGRTIRKDAFKDDDGKRVTLFWNHDHDSVDSVIGHALLENRAEGVYAYCSLNNTPSGMKAKEAVAHGDVEALSIYANKLQQQGSNVLHGCIKEVSLVPAGANPGAHIESVFITHSDNSVDEEAVIYNDSTGIEVDDSLLHSDDVKDKIVKAASKLKPAEPDANKDDKPAESDADKDDKTADEQVPSDTETSDSTEATTITEAFSTLDETQLKAVAAVIGQIIETEINNKGVNKSMAHNVFENDANQGNTLTHSDEAAILASAKKLGSLKDASEEYLEHTLPEYGIEHIDYLFPEAQNLNPTPEFIKRDTDWVSVIMNGVKHTPFSRVRSTFANITMDEARARGYIKSKQKKDEVFTLLKRTTDPQTIYKKQKMDRDDVIDITDFNVVSWLKTEMRMMLDEEIARAILIGDGRGSSDDDKISEDHIRSVANDANLYTITKEFDMSLLSQLMNSDGEFIQTNLVTGTGDTLGQLQLATEAIIANINLARVNYKGTGNPIAFLPEVLLAIMLLTKDANGRRIYNDEADLAKAMRVSKIVTCPLLDENLTDTSNDGKPIIVIFNPADYNVGADKGGAVSMFEDFDINYNQMLYLIETRCSGALVKPYSAIVLKKKNASM